MNRIKLLVLIGILMTVGDAMAQWRVGATIGAVNNRLSIDTQYQYDWRYDSRWGVQAGISGQYDVNDWFGIRADLAFQQRGYTQRRTEKYASPNKGHYRDNYLTLPVMASFSFGGEKLRGFLNAGVYGGYWLSSLVKGVSSDPDRVADGLPPDKFEEIVDLSGVPYQRWDFGGIAGVGVEYRLCSHWAAQIEARYYYSVISKKKQYQATKDYQYNNPVSLTVGVYYSF
jgi:opacity protein-like surface antigen